MRNLDYDGRRKQQLGSPPSSTLSPEAAHCINLLCNHDDSVEDFSARLVKPSTGFMLEYDPGDPNSLPAAYEQVEGKGMPCGGRLSNAKHHALTVYASVEVP